MIAIEARDLGKKYRQFSAAAGRGWRELVERRFPSARNQDYRWSLRHVSFSLERGRALGVIGRNGAGKSTLLRTVGNILRPDEGAVQANGRIGGLLELTAGLHADLTGRENAVIGGVIRGLTKKEVLHRFDSIVAFAELAEVIDRPLRTYSSGMQMRLAFAVAVHSDPDVLLVDEVLAVGDLAFQEKCLTRIRSMQAGGCSIVLVSHDTGLIQHMCDEAIWLDHGQVVEQGVSASVMSRYVAVLRNQTQVRTPVDISPSITSQGIVLRLGQNRFGALEVEITDVRLSTNSDPLGIVLTDGGSLSVEMEFLVHEVVQAPIFSVTVIHDDGRACLTANTEQSPVTLPADVREGKMTVRWPRVNLEPGTYFVEVGVYERSWAHAYDYHARCYTLLIRASPRAGSDGRLVGDQPQGEWFVEQVTQGRS